MKVFKAHYNRCLPLLVTVALVLTSINLPNDVLNIEAKTDEQGSNIFSGSRCNARTVSTHSEDVEENITKSDSIRIYTSNQGDFSAALNKKGDLYCWGNNQAGRVGNGNTVDQLTPVKVLGKVKKFAMGSDHTAAITENGDLYCWGDNSFGQVGMGTDNVIQKEPVKILENIKDISLGYWCSAAISEKGDLYCWGCNRNGQVGNGTYTEKETRPIKILDNVKNVYTSETACRIIAITEKGDLYCWGYNKYGQIGNGDEKTVTEPVKILEDVKLLPNTGMGAAIRKNNDLYCWGYNGSGQVGNGTVINQLKPVKILENINEVVCGNGHNMAVSCNGEVYAWGYNGYGQVGNGTTENQLKPVKVLSLADITDIIPVAEKIPKLSADSAKQFLAFVYNDSKYEEVDLTNDKYYKLLTGDLSSYNDDVDQLLADIHAFSMFVRSNIDSQLSQSDKNTKYLSDNLIEYFKSELNGMSEVDDQVFKEYEKTWSKRLENGLVDIMSTELATHTGIVVTEDMYANIELGIGTYKDIANIGDKTTTYVRRLCAGVQGFFLPLEKEKLGRYSYFSSYLDNRGSYSSSNDMVFETIMDYNFLAAKENSYISSAIDMTTWITGKDSWSNHREELDQWAEYLYQLESFVKLLYKTEEKPVTPTATPTVSPTVSPTATPTVSPTVTPTVSPTATPTVSPTVTPTVSPTATPTVSPTVSPTATPTVSPTATPTVSPAATPTVSPSVTPTEKPKVTPISVNRLERVVVGTVKNIRGRKVVVKWKNVVGISGYQIQYAANKKYKKAKKTVTHKKQYVIKKLRKKKTYYIRVRAYTVYNGKTVYGRWSKVKKVKIKK